MKNRSFRLSVAVVAVGLVVGGIAVSMPVASSAATAKPAVLHGHAPKYSFTQLMGGLFFDVGTVGKLAYNKEMGSTMTTNESKIVKAFSAALGTSSTKGSAAVAAELQSGSTSEFTKGIAAIDAKASVLGSTPGLSPSNVGATVQERANVARARASLIRSGAMGSTCASNVAAGATSCAMNPAAVQEHGIFWVQIVVAVVVAVAVAVVLILLIVAVAKPGNPNNKGSVAEIAKLTKALA